MKSGIGFGLFCLLIVLSCDSFSQESITEDAFKDQRKIFGEAIQPAREFFSVKSQNFSMDTLNTMAKKIARVELGGSGSANYLPADDPRVGARANELLYQRRQMFVTNSGEPLRKVLEQRLLLHEQSANLRLLDMRHRHYTQIAEALANRKPGSQNFGINGITAAGQAGQTEGTMMQIRRDLEKTQSRLTTLEMTARGITADVVRSDGMLVKDGPRPKFNSTYYTEFQFDEKMSFNPKVHHQAPKDGYKHANKVFKETMRNNPVTPPALNMHGPGEGPIHPGTAPLGID